MFKKIIILIICLFIATNGDCGIDFDLVDDRVTITPAASIDNMSAITLSVWINSDVSGAQRRIVSKSGADTTGWRLRILANDTLGFVCDYTPTSDMGSISTTTITEGSWQHILVTWDGSATATNVHIYINGTEVTYTTQTNGDNTRANDSTAGLFVGMRSDGAQPFGGEITEVAIWNVVLTAPQIALLANSRIKGIPLQIQPSALKVYLPMDDQTTGTSADADRVRDLSGNGNNGTGNDGTNNTGLSWSSEVILSYPSAILTGN